MGRVEVEEKKGWVGGGVVLGWLGRVEGGGGVGGGGVGCGGKGGILNR